jgi:hypothetical protein
MSKTPPTADAAGRPLPLLLAPLESPQQLVVDILADVFFTQAGRWPTFQYLQARLDQAQHDAAAVLASFPAVGGRTFNERRYAAVWAENFGVAPHDAGRVGLTIAGLAHCAEPFQQAAEIQIRFFLRVLAVMVEHRRGFLPPPTEVEELRVSDAEVLDALGRFRGGAHAWDRESIYAVMEHEPPLYGSSRSHNESGWSRGVSRDLLSFEGIDDVSDYVERVSALVTPPAVEVPRALPSPLDLVAGLDFLDAVWRNVPGHSEHFVRYQRGESTAKLTYPANTGDEFWSRLSGLGEVLKALNVPKGGAQHGGHPVERLRQYLLWRLDENSHARIVEAIDTLSAVIDVRNAGQHPEADARSVQALKRLGLNFPILEWGSAWMAIQAETIGALEAIREELSTLSG